MFRSLPCNIIRRVTGVLRVLCFDVFCYWSLNLGPRTALGCISCLNATTQERFKLKKKSFFLQAGSKYESIKMCVRSALTNTVSEFYPENKAKSVWTQLRSAVTQNDMFRQHTVTCRYTKDYCEAADDPLWSKYVLLRNNRRQLCWMDFCLLVWYKQRNRMATFKKESYTAYFFRRQVSTAHL